MNIEFATLDTCADAAGVVVVIDVRRAFTTAAYAYGAGVNRILLAGTAGEALALRERFPGSLVMGEVDGLPVAEFDLWNSPAQMSALKLPGRTLIQRTSSGTQGIVRSIRAEHLLAASFAVAGATAKAIRTRAPNLVTFVITGGSPDDPRYGLEDRACAEYIAALLRDEHPDWRGFMRWEPFFREVHQLGKLPEPLRSQFYADLSICCIVDRWPWALVVGRQENLLIMENEAHNG
jgi:2-phosphosulfolactate phosphatase